MPNFFAKIWEAIKHFLTRPGMKTFLSDHYEAAVQHVKDYVEERGGLTAISFKDIDGELFNLLKAATGTDKDNWVVALKAFAIEAVKAAAEK